ncbi:MAG: hypothetical protein KDD12_23405, partial [Lewinella sp.]|nr:hypothetical protein [Lewinella sp.]
RFPALSYLCFDSSLRSSSMPIRGTHNGLLSMPPNSQLASPTHGSKPTVADNKEKRKRKFD